MIGMTHRRIAAIALGASLFFVFPSAAQEAPTSGDIAPNAASVPPHNVKQRARSRGERSAAAKTSPKNEAPEGAYIEALANGGYDVTWPDGCVARYDKQGRPFNYSEACDEPKAAESQLIVDSYRR
ncbi:hypothetical protein WOC76_04125 [Methylocystis sp. IM3]|jgi:hypothetical protein|uniref:hypothetical protein n=1 Tax=Methylocystis sp. IM3 TaxID=3136722 RepID=UPI003119B3D2